MSLWSGLGNIFHSIGSFFGGDNEEQKKKQQQIVQPPRAVSVAPTGGFSQPSTNQQPSQSAPKQDQFLNLFQNGTLQKAAAPSALPPPKPQPVIPPPTAQPAKATPKPSLFHRITHGALNVAEGGAGLSLGVLRTGEGLVQGATQIPSTALHLYDWAANKLSGNSGNSRVTKAVDTATRTVDKPIDWLAKKTDEAALGYGGGSEAVYKPAQIAANVLTLVPGAVAAGSKVAQAAKLEKVSQTLAPVEDVIKAQTEGSPVLRAANLVKARLFGAKTAPDEVAPGVHSTNTKPEVPEPAQTPLQAEASDINTPAYQRTPLKKAAAAETASARTAAEEAVAPTTALDTTPAIQHKQAVQDVIEQGDQELTDFVNTNPGASKAEIDTARQTISDQVTTKIQALNDARYGAQAAPEAATPAVPEVTPAQPPAPQAVAPPTPLAPATPEAAAAGAEAPVPTPAPATPPAPEPTAVNPVPGAQVAPNAPNVRAALEKQLNDAGAPLDRSGTVHEVVSNPQLDQAAQNLTATLSDEELLNAYKNGATFHNAADIAKGNAAFPRLAEMAKAGSPEAQTAIENILDAIETATSSGGRTLNYVQTLFDQLPREVKVNVIIRNIDKKREALGLNLIKDDPAMQKQVIATIDRYLSVGEEEQAKLAALRGEAEANIERAKAGGTKRADTRAGEKLQSAVKAAELDVEKNQGDLAQYYDTLVPTKKLSQENIGDTTRTLMLSSVTGRLNDPLTTSFNLIHTLLNQTGESILGKAGNVVGGGGRFVSKLPSVRTLVRGSRAALKKSAGEVRGNVYAGGDLRKAMENKGLGGRTQLSRATGGPLTKTRRFIRATAEFATNMSEGIKNVEAERLAFQEGKQLGLKGRDLKTYAANRVAVPSRIMEENASKLHEEVNNLNDNWLTDALEKASDVMTHVPVVGQTLKNLTFPFTRWLGGQAYNLTMNKNSVANVVKFANAIRKGDGQAALKELAAFTQNTAAALTVGYGLAKAGVLTTTDAQGYSDNGLYLHIGKHYVPATFFGFFAPSLILGYSTYHGLNDNTDASPAQKIGDIFGKTFDATWRAVGGSSLLGQDNSFVRTLSDYTSKGSTTTAGDLAEVFGSQAASQFIPGFAGDINAVLNQTSLNPTHESADTKVENPNSKSGHAKDVGKTAIKQLENRIPGLSQTFPRKAGVAAPTEFDRLVRGGAEDTGATVKASQLAKAEADQSAYDKAKDIPNPNDAHFSNAIEARIERGEYDKVIPGLQQKITAMQKDKNTPQSDVEKVQNQLKFVQVAQKTGTTPEVISLYKQTNLTEWRAMGDPESDSYNPRAYELLFRFDSQLAKEGVAGATKTTQGSSDKGKYYAKKSSSRSGSSKKSTALRKAQSNKLGSLVNIGTPDYSQSFLSKENIPADQIPKVLPLKPEQLIKKRKITVSKA